MDEQQVQQKVETAAKTIWVWGGAHQQIVTHVAAFVAGFLVRWMWF